jgi:cytochrome c2
MCRFWFQPMTAAVTAGWLVGTPISVVNAADPSSGKTVFGANCTTCHSVQPGRNMVGPNLFGIIGRKTGTVPGFHYSTANQNASIVWSEAIMNKYLQSPRSMIPGTIMTYAGLKNDEKRADLVAYLATLK